MTELTGKVGFASPIAHRTFANRRRGIELFATVALAVSLVIAATAVSIGMARAQAPTHLLSR
jgi:regulator of sirC expression with transglutaminase-like and TPR domain